jgi:hypothetical protein
MNGILGFGILGPGTETFCGFGTLTPPILIPFASGKIFFKECVTLAVISITFQTYDSPVWRLYITNTPIVSTTLKAIAFILKLCFFKC